MGLHYMYMAMVMVVIISNLISELKAKFFSATVIVDPGASALKSTLTLAHDRIKELVSPSTLALDRM